MLRIFRHDRWIREWRKLRNEGIYNVVEGVTETLHTFKMSWESDKYNMVLAKCQCSTNWTETDSVGDELNSRE